MKKSLVLFCSFLSLAMPHAAEAAFSFTATHEYGNAAGKHQPASASGSYGVDYVNISKADSSPFYDLFNLEGAGNLTAATLTVTHNGNFDLLLPSGLGEKWEVVGNNGKLGSLTNSFYDWQTGSIMTSWVTDTFALSPEALAAINNAHSKYLGVAFAENTQGQNSFRLNSLTFTASGTEPVAQVPLPPTMLLFGSGIIGLAGFRRMGMKR